ATLGGSGPGRPDRDRHGAGHRSDPRRPHRAGPRRQRRSGPAADPDGARGRRRPGVGHRPGGQCRTHPRPGATPIPSDATDWTAELQRATDGRGVDVVLDTHYHSTFLPSLDQIAEGGLIVTLPTLADISPATERGLTARIPRILPGRDRLDRLVQGIR